MIIYTIRNQIYIYDICIIVMVKHTIPIQTLSHLSELFHSIYILESIVKYSFFYIIIHIQ